MQVKISHRYKRLEAMLGILAAVVLTITLGACGRENCAAPESEPARSEDAADMPSAAIHSKPDIPAGAGAQDAAFSPIFDKPTAETAAEVRGQFGAFTHAVGVVTEFYRTGPMQASPPDGSVQQGLKAILVEDGGSYVYAAFENGITGWVIRSALVPLPKNSETGEPDPLPGEPAHEEALPGDKTMPPPP